MKLIINWSSHTVKNGFISIPRYVELHSEKIRKKYLDFVYDLGQSSVKEKKIVEHLKFDSEFSLWWMTLIAEKSIYKSPLIQECLKMFALEDILNFEKYSVIHIYDVYSSKSRISIMHLCEAKNIEVTFVSNRKKKENAINLKSVYQFLPYTVQGVIALVHDVVIFSSLKKTLGPKWFSGNRSVFIFSYFIHLDEDSLNREVFYSRQWEVLPKLLHSLGYKINWMHHFLFSNEVPTVSKGVEYIRRLNLKRNKTDVYQFLSSYLTLSIVKKAFFKWINIIWVSFRLRKQVKSLFYPKNSSINLWPLLKNDWYKSTQGRVGIENILWLYLMDKALNDLPQQKLGLYLYEGQGWERAFVYIWKKYNHGKLIGVADTTVRYWDLRYFNNIKTIVDNESLSMPQPDKVAVNGAFSRDNLKDAYFPSKRLESVEALRYLHLSRVNKKKVSSIDGSLRLLVLGGYMPNTIIEMMNLLSSKKNKESVERYDITVKAHPSNPIQVKDFPSLQFEITTDPLQDLLHKFDLVYGDNLSGANLEAYLSGLPVILHFIDGDLVVSPLSGLKNVSFVCNSAEIRKALDKKYSRKNIQQDDIFWLDNNLPKWRNLIANS
jgi:surface carbohydrate biosynthesis protein (TIGR04326 family)